MTSHIYRPERGNMLERGFAEGTQRQGTVDAGKLKESRRGYKWSRRRCLFFILLLGLIFLFYNTKKVASDWNLQSWLQNNGIKKWDSIEKKKGICNSAGLNMTSRWPASLLIENSSVASLPQKPVPYKSPGPYLVEYPYEYHFIINEPQKCEQHKPFLVLMVPVAPHNRADRDIVRSTWGGEDLLLGKVVKLLFLLGLQTGEGAEQLQEQLLQESKEHQDLIQSNFVDCYKNLTIKTMVMLEWLDSHCSGASYAMKIDSDMFLNLPNLIHMLLSAPKSNYMTGLVERGAAVLRDQTSKWYVPEELYPDPQYPCYALGLGYVLSLDLPKKLVEASRHIKALYIEDVYLGLCMQYLGIPPTDPPEGSHFSVFPVPYSRCAYSRLIATTTHDNADRVRNWKDFKKTDPHC